MIKAVLIACLFAGSVFGQGMRGGMMSDDYVAAWQRATRGAVAYQYPTNGLVAYYSMDSRSANDVTVFDTFGSNNGTAVGVYEFFSVFTVNEDAFAVIEGRLSVGNVSDLSFDRTNAFTISGWIRFTGNSLTSGALEILSKQANAGNFQGYGWEHLGVSSANTFRFFMRSATGNQLVIDTSKRVDGNEWQHVVTTHDGTGTAAGTRIYFDGNEVSKTVTENTLTGSILSTAPFQLSGRDGANRQWSSGRYDEVAIWNRALSSSEVSEIYNNGAGRFYTP